MGLKSHTKACVKHCVITDYDYVYNVIDYDYNYTESRNGNHDYNYFRSCNRVMDYSSTVSFALTIKRLYCYSVRSARSTNHGHRFKLLLYAGIYFAVPVNLCFLFGNKLYFNYLVIEHL